MEREREHFLKSLLGKAEKDNANGFYSRKLLLTLRQLQIFALHYGLGRDAPYALHNF